MMRLPYYLYTYREHSQAKPADIGGENAPPAIPLIFWIAVAVWTAIVAYAVLVSW